MSILTDKVGRILFALPFAVFGLFHFMNAGNMTGMIPGWMPLAVFWVYLTGLALIAASVSIIIEKKTRLAGILLGVMLLIFVFTIHIPGIMGGSETAMPNLLKDAALAGAAWYLAGHYENGESEEASDSGGGEDYGSSTDTGGDF